MPIFDYADWSPAVPLPDANDPSEPFNSPYEPYVGNPPDWEKYANPYLPYTGSVNLPGATRFNAPEIEKYEEDWTDGHSVTRNFIIDFPLQNFFADLLLGSATLPLNFASQPVASLGLQRRLPKRDPVYPNLFAESVKAVEFRGAHVRARDFVDQSGDNAYIPNDDRGDTMVFVDGSPDPVLLQKFNQRVYTNPGKVVMQVVFREPTYRVLADVQGQNQAHPGQRVPENLRWTDWTPVMAGDAIQLPVGTFKFTSTNQPIPAGGSKPLPLMNLKVYWSKVPLPTQAMFSYYGTVNATKITFGGAVSFTAEPETLFYAGAQEVGKQRYFPNGMPYRDYELNFIYRKNKSLAALVNEFGWNNLYQPSVAEFNPVSYHGFSLNPPNAAGHLRTEPGYLPFTPVEFKDLFSYP